MARCWYGFWLGVILLNSRVGVFYDVVKDISILGLRLG